MLHSFDDFKNFALAARDGDIGKIKELYFDDRTWTVRYVVVDTGNWLMDRRVLIAPRSLGEIDAQRKTISVQLSKEQIEQSPPIDADKPVSRQHEIDWHHYYGFPVYWMGGVPFGGAPIPLGPMETLEPSEPEGDPNLRSTSEVAGYPIHATDGEIGEVDGFIIDDETWRIRHLVVSQGWLEKRVLLSPEWIERVSWEDRSVFVPFSREAIKDAPEWDGVEMLTPDFDRRLHDYYKRHFDGGDTSTPRRRDDAAV